MFSTSGLFKNITCPNGDRCRLPNCIFSHILPVKKDEQPRVPASQLQKTVDTDDDAFTQNAYHKRRKLDDGTKAALLTEEHSHPTKPEQKPFVGILTSNKSDVVARPLSAIHSQLGTVTNKAQPVSGSTASHSSSTSLRAEHHSTGNAVLKPLETVSKRVSPPPRGIHSKHKLGKSANASKPETKESLNPRLLAQSPAGHDVRTVYLKNLHAGMVRLNEAVSKHSDPTIKSLHLTDNELIKAALDEEEKMAREQSAVYGNVIKLRMVAYKKMKIEDWAKLRTQLQAEKQNGNADPKAHPPPIETGLTPAEEVLMLPRLVADQKTLSNYGYVTSPPTDSEIQAAREGVDSAGGWEVCDRCKTRFQVFPHRRQEDGALTTGGTCTHHWGRPYTPKYDRTDATQGRKGATYSCCNEPVGSSTGCTTCPTHVFKISEAKRLALVLPFVVTPANPNVSGEKAVAFDCEMGYTTYGLELIRLTAASWPDGKPLIDVLVRPLGHILDLNSRFSGIFPEHFTNALPYDYSDAAPPPPPVTGTANGNTSPATPQQLRIVPTPAAARSLLLSHIAPSTPLIGHALENDLNAVRLVHPTLIDTVLLFPHPRGLPLRYGLKMLVKQHLQRDIQTAGAAGHDSLEDARATGDLVRWKVGREWQKLRQEGWTVREGSFYPPLPPGEPGLREGGGKPAELPPYGGGQGLLGSKGRKKKRGIGQVDGTGETEDEAG